MCRVRWWLLLALIGGSAGATEPLATLAQRAELELRGNILPFWLAEVPHPSRGGFHGEVIAAGQPRADAPRASLMTSRILWTFSAAYEQWPEPEYLRMAERAYADLTETMADPAHGGYFWSVTDQGQPLSTLKHVYGQAFALYGLSEYARVTDHAAARERAVALYHLIEDRARDRVHGGYHEAFTREWQRQPADAPTVIGPGAFKSQNTHLHLMEAYTNLLRLWPDEGLRQSLRELVEVILDRMVDIRTAHLGLYFEEDWTPRSAAISYGHDIEFAWLVTAAATELGDATLLTRVQTLAVRFAAVTLAEGVENDGGIPYEAGPGGVTDDRREWWVPAEAAVGFLHAYQLSGDDRFRRAAWAQWDYIERHLVDRSGGEWHHSVRPGGALVTGRSKADAWKCPYHNGRACLELIKRARAGAPAGDE